jgi:hydrogenase nickel incorporation protein HypA/HybF
MHEEALLRDLRRKLDGLMPPRGPGRIVRVDVRLGALSHLTDSNFRALWPRVVEGTAARNARLTVEVSSDPAAAEAQGVVLLRVVVDDGPGTGTSRPRPPIEPGASS